MKQERIFLNESDKRVYVDAYVVSGEIRDAMLVIPGGGLWSISAREGEPIALEFLSRGYNAFVLNYRVREPGDVYPAQLLDAGAAMIYIREHAEELSINPERVFAIGFSAGGYIVGSISTMFEYPEAIEAFGEKHRMIRPDASILAYPVTIARANTHPGTFRQLLGKPLSEYTEEEVRKFSIDTAISSDSSPMFIWHTAEDQGVPAEGSLKTALALTAAKVPYRLTVYPYGVHGVSLANEITACGNPDFIQPIAEDWVREADEWLKTI